MKEAAQAMKRVNSELLTPLGDEDILDWREIDGIGTFCTKIFPDRRIASITDSYNDILLMSDDIEGIGYYGTSEFWNSSRCISELKPS